MGRAVHFHDQPPEKWLSPAPELAPGNPKLDGWVVRVLGRYERCGVPGGTGNRPRTTGRERRLRRLLCDVVPATCSDRVRSDWQRRARRRARAGDDAPGA